MLRVVRKSERVRRLPTLALFLSDVALVLNLRTSITPIITPVAGAVVIDSESRRRSGCESSSEEEPDRGHRRRRDRRHWRHSRREDSLDGLSPAERD